MKKTVGILDLQGGVAEHYNILKKFDDIRVFKIKKPQELINIDGLIIPGGESTTIGKLIKKYGFKEPIIEMYRQKKPLWGTCAGLIILAEKIEGQNFNYLGIIDITVRRNAYGSQLNSFITKKSIPLFSKNLIELVFIRAPIITEVGLDVRILARVQDNIVAVEKDNVLLTSFHPELTDDIAVHSYFINKL